MNRQLTERLAKRLDAIEARRPERLPSITWVVVEPGEHGPVPTGEVVTWHPGEPNPWNDHAPE